MTREVYWWNNMNNVIVEFVAKCLNCQQKKVVQQSPCGMAQDIELLKWKYEMINIHFIIMKPRSYR